MPKCVVIVYNQSGGLKQQWQTPNSTRAIEQAKVERAKGARVTVHSYITGKILFGRKDNG